MTPDRAQEFPQALSGQPMDGVLLSYQRQAIAKIQTHPLVVVEKSRRIGLTWGVAALAALTAASQASAGGMDVFYMGTEAKMAREFIDSCAMWSRAYALVGERAEVEEYVYLDEKEGEATRSIQAYRIRMASGFDVEALSSAPRSLRGRQGLVVLDEAAFMSDLDEVIKAALALLMWGGRVVVISTHDGADNPFNGLCQQVREGRRPGAAIVRITFEEALAAGLWERIKLTKPATPAKDVWIDTILGIYAENADEELHVIPRSGSGAYFKASLLARMKRPIPVVSWTAPDDLMNAGVEGLRGVVDDWIARVLEPLVAEAVPETAKRSVVGEDFGRHADMSAIWVLVEALDGWRTPFVLELRDCPHAAQLQIMLWLARTLPRLSHIAMDATGNGEGLAEQVALHLGLAMVSQVKISTSWYGRNMPLLLAAIDEGDVPIPEDEDVQADFRAVELVRGIPQIGRRTKGRNGGWRHGDTAVAAALARYAAEQHGGPVDPGRSVEDLAETGPGIDRDRDAPLDDYRGSLGGSLDDYRRM